jgi:hypothetical protein
MASHINRHDRFHGRLHQFSIPMRKRQRQRHRFRRIDINPRGDHSRRRLKVAPTTVTFQNPLWTDAAGYFKRRIKTFQRINFSVELNVPARTSRAHWGIRDPQD